MALPAESVSQQHPSAKDIELLERALEADLGLPRRSS
jgi:hypothetical protein